MVKHVASLHHLPHPPPPHTPSITYAMHLHNNRALRQGGHLIRSMCSQHPRMLTMCKVVHMVVWCVYTWNSCAVVLCACATEHAVQMGASTCVCVWMWEGIIMHRQSCAHCSCCAWSTFCMIKVVHGQRFCMIKIVHVQHRIPNHIPSSCKMHLCLW